MDELQQLKSEIVTLQERVEKLEKFTGPPVVVYRNYSSGDGYVTAMGAEIAGNVRDGIVQSIDTARWEV